MTSGQALAINASEFSQYLTAYRDGKYSHAETAHREEHS